MSAIRFQTTSKGKLPHLSYMFRKPEPLGTEFKAVACSVTGYLLFIEVQKLNKGLITASTIRSLERLQPLIR